MEAEANKRAEASRALEKQSRDAQAVSIKMAADFEAQANASAKKA